MLTMHSTTGGKPPPRRARLEAHVDGGHAAASVYFGAAPP